MAKAPNEKIEKAKALYKNGMKLIDIANQLEVPAGTVRRWKSTHNWDGERSAKKASVRSNKKSTKKSKKEPLPPEVESVIDNPHLTNEQRLFCLLYSRSFNATKSYQKAYGCDYTSAMSNGSRLIRNDRVKEEILRLKEERYARDLISEKDIFQKYWDIAFSDITDFMVFGRQEVQVVGPFGPVMVKNEDGIEVPLMEEVNFTDFKESTEVDGSLISEIKSGKGGASIKLADRTKALNWLADHMDLATAEQKARINKLHAETVIKEDREAKVNQIVQIYIPENGRDAGK